MSSEQITQETVPVETTQAAQPAAIPSTVSWWRYSNKLEKVL
jgi:hypothetical protein